MIKSTSLDNEGQVNKSRILLLKLMNDNKHGNMYNDLIDDYNHLHIKYKEIAEMNEDEEILRNCYENIVKERDAENAMAIITFKNNLNESKSFIEKEDRIALLHQALNHSIRMLSLENGKLKSVNETLKVKHTSKLKAVNLLENMIKNQENEIKKLIQENKDIKIDNKRIKNTIK